MKEKPRKQSGKKSKVTDPVTLNQAGMIFVFSP